MKCQKRIVSCLRQLNVALEHWILSLSLSQSSFRMLGKSFKLNFSVGHELCVTHFLGHLETSGDSYTEVVSSHNHSWSLALNILECYKNVKYAEKKKSAHCHLQIRHPPLSTKTVNSLLLLPYSASVPQL